MLTASGFLFEVQLLWTTFHIYIIFDHISTEPGQLSEPGISIHPHEVRNACLLRLHSLYGAQPLLGSTATRPVEMHKRTRPEGDHAKGTFQPTNLQRGAMALPVPLSLHQHVSKRADVDGRKLLCDTTSHAVPSLSHCSLAQAAWRQQARLSWISGGRTR